jgi:hypothetical protein
MLVYETYNSFSPVQFSEMGMILASDNLRHRSTFNDCSLLQWVDIEMMLASVIL